jgi:hypothetical protein
MLPGHFQVFRRQGPVDLLGGIEVTLAIPEIRQHGPVRAIAGMAGKECVDGFDALFIAPQVVVNPYQRSMENHLQIS